MKTIIYTIFITLSFLVFSNICYSQGIGSGEFMIVNRTNSYQIMIKMYPIGAVFNGALKYNLEAVNQVDPSLRAKYIWGIQDTLEWTSPGYAVRANFDDSTSGGTLLGLKFSVGYGVYKIEFWRESGGIFDQLVDTCYMDWRDAGFRVQGHYPSNQGNGDIVIDYFSTDSITFEHSSPGSHLVNIKSTNRHIKYWEFMGTDLEDSNIVPLNGPFFSDNLNSYSLNYPIDARDSGAVNHIRSGDLALFLRVDHDVNTKVLGEEFINMVVTKRAALIISPDKTFNMITPSSPAGGFTNLIIQDTAYLTLHSNSKIIVNTPNKITLKSLSNLTMLNNSAIVVEPGGVYCNEGASLRGAIRIIYNGIHYLCAIDNFTNDDSTKIIISDSSTLVIPDDYIMKFKGNSTSLVMGAASKIKFGENSGLVFEDGARLVANNAEFSSIDSTKKWNGIVLSDLSQDTIKNCVIKNSSGISIIDKIDISEPSPPYSTEISGCTFINKTSAVLNSGINISNSNNVLIKGNTFSSTVVTLGFTFGIYAEYCPAGDFIICDNTIANASTGLMIAQTSPYIARNTITGNSYTEYGIVLDNYSGTFEYNVITGNYINYYSLYSLPYLLKNTFNTTDDKNLYISASSVPIMHPIISGTLKTWVAGDNLITGSPVTSGIFFDSDSYPDIENGYNMFELPSTEFYLQGEAPASLAGKLEMYFNYWDDPQESKFDVTNAVIYITPYDGGTSTPRLAEYYTLHDIGFGMYDSVFTNEDTDNPVAEEMYLQAYKKEYSGQFDDAIDIYKDIISTYKDSVFSSSALSRIFNCHEKKRSTLLQYASLETYYTDIFNDTSYNSLLQSISEDFVIKSVVNQSRLQDAMSDYNTMYSENTNTSKGIHALINKEILMALLGDTTDNIMGSSLNLENLNDSKLRISSILKGLRNENLQVAENITPGKMYLSQNYPNPFNPTTNIQYNLRSDNIVSIKVYDLLGKEVMTLVNEFKNAGSYIVSFNGVNLASGVYYYKIKAGSPSTGSGQSFEQIMKMVLLK